MLHLAGQILIKNSSACPRLAQQCCKTLLITNRRWMTQKIQRIPNLRTTGIQSDEERKKITPLGWFLLLVPATTFALGCWQVKRKAWKEQLLKDMEQKTKLPAVPLPENLDDLQSMEYRLVQLRGTFLHDKEMYLGPRSFIRPDGAESGSGLFSQRDATNGYLVITPFKLADRDDIVLINRGWVSRKQKLPQTRLQGQYDKELELTCVVRQGEKRPQFSPEHKGDIYLYRDLPRMSAAAGSQPILLDATYESSVPGGPIGGQTRVTLRNEHLSYLITWFSLSGATAFMWYRQIIKGKPF